MYRVKIKLLENNRQNPTFHELLSAYFVQYCVIF